MSLKHKRILPLILIFSFVLFCLSSCGMKAEQKSLTAHFDTIDALIMQGQMQDAVKELKKVEKKAFDSWSYIGIYKRYSKLGEKKLSEKLLKKALKKNPTNTELKVVYTKLLLNNDRVEEALELSKELKGTKYGSLHSEAVMKQAFLKSDTDSFVTKDFFQIYMDAYTGSKNPVWIRNCAVYNLLEGLFLNAADLNPGYYADADDAYFWSLVLYDAGKYYEAINGLENAKSYLKDYSSNKKTKVTQIAISGVESDAYMAVSDAQAAEAIRQEIIINIDNLEPKNQDESLLPVIVTNSAVYAYNQENNDSCADLLFYTVNRWPDYIPALILYADFAYQSNLERQEDSEIIALRKNGIKTLEMEKYDNRRKIPMSDAFYRIDESNNRKPDPYLFITKLDLKYKMNPDISEKEKTVDLWNLLEENYSESEKYNLLLVQYAINYLLSNKLESDAWQLFIKYTNEHCDIDKEEDFWKQFIEQKKNIDLSIVEIGAWFAAELKKIDEAIRLYEYCVYESAGILDDMAVSSMATTSSCMNLADIYYSTGKKEKALDLYGKAAGRESNNAKRSEIFYRIACIYVSMGDTKNALRSADYACSIYPENARASLLKGKISIQQ